MTSQEVILLGNKLAVVGNTEDVIPFKAIKNNIALIETSNSFNTRLVTNTDTLLEVIMTLLAPDLLMIVVLYQEICATSFALI